ncbi:flagellin [Spartinivicinus poritis]|uniref:flagellin N-terminal helical domain-containing protein n=1 Tax=Spartinivicinus poritis TaxID=2994640 RepID=UPI00237C6913|nr:flagellin [Spartinivicinus sp. A2-2]
MPQIINTNIASLNAQRNLDSSQAATDLSLQRLSSGLRINSAKDDAAGLAISTRFDSQIRGTSVAIRNSNDGISLAQTAEGALASITSSLQRIRELALQSANGSNTDVDRVALNEEVQQLVTEIQNVAEKTNFNGTKLLDGSFDNTLFQTGANLGDTIDVSIAKVTTNSLGSSLVDGVSSTRTAPANNSALNAGDLVINGVAISASSGADDSFSTVSQDQSSIAKAAVINRASEQTGVTARVNANVVGYSGVAATNATVAAGASIKINGVVIKVSADTNLDADTNREATIASINAVSAQTGVRGVNTGDANTGITLIADDGRNIAYDDNGSGIAAAVGLSDGAAGTDTYTGTFTLISRDGSDIQLNTNNATNGNGGIDNAGLQVGTFSGVNSGLLGRELTTAALVTGDLVINGVAIGPSLVVDDTASTVNKDGSAIAKSAAINRVSSQTGVIAQTAATQVFGEAITAGNDRTESIKINDVLISVSFGAADTVGDIQAAVITAVNSKSGQTGVRAEAFGQSFRLIADDGRNIRLDTGSGNVADAGFGANIAGAGTTHLGSINLLSAGKIELTSNTASGGITKSGFEVGTYGNGDDGQLVKDIDISSVEGANEAIVSVENALQQISSQQAQLGAIQNRFLSTINNLSISNENLSAANSRIRDADFAAETAELSRAQVLQQAGISVLAQANARPQQVLSLLQ